MHHESLLPRSVKVVVAVLLFAAALPLQSAVVIAPSDEAMIRMAPAAVTGTVVQVYARHDDRGNIETVARVLVDETIKGSTPPGALIEVVQFGGILEGRFQAQSGAPAYETGARYLVLLDRNGRGDWTTFELALGQFHFVNRDGKELLVRDTHEVTGWTESGEPFRDRDRPAAEFLSFARRVVKTLTQPRIAPDALRAAPLTLDYDLKGISQTSVNTWHNAAAAMNDTVSATPASGDTKDLNDVESRIIADDPHGDISGSCCPGIVATAFFGCNPCNTSTFNGESYTAINVSDVVINDGVSSSTLSSGNFLSAVVHELGHTWGFRHSNQSASNGACALPLPCTSSALMNSSLVGGLNGTLQGWDLDAANEVYGDGSRQPSFTGTQYVYTLGIAARRPNPMTWRISQAACTAPSIATQPQSQSITSGQQANLSVLAAGTAPFTYLWYTGAPPTGPVAPGPNNTSSTYNPSPTVTTTYWVRVMSSCGTIDSGVATVTVNQGSCTPPSIVTQPNGSTISAGQFANLSVGAAGTTPIAYQWYVGTPTDTSNPIASGQSINVNPSQTTSYWVRVTGQCGTPADSRPVTVTVTAATCTPPSVVNEPPDQTITAGNPATLFVGYTGSTSTITWYRGVQNDKSNPAGVGQSINTAALFFTTQFWAELVNGCGTAKSRTVTINVVTACVPPAIAAADVNPKNVAPGGTVTLTAQATGTSLQFQWYRGTSPDTSNPVPGGNAAVATDTPPASTSYFVRVSNACGTKDSDPVRVVVSAACTPPSVTQITNDTTVSSNTSVTLTVAAAGDATLHYQWYRGPSGDATSPVGTDSASFPTPALFIDEQFWVKVSNACAPPANSKSVKITVMPARHRAARK